MLFYYDFYYNYLTYSDNDSAKLCMLASSKFVVGSSSASIPQFLLKVSANAILTIRHANT